MTKTKQQKNYQLYNQEFDLIHHQSAIEAEWQASLDLYKENAM